MELSFYSNLFTYRYPHVQPANHSGQIDFSLPLIPHIQCVSKTHWLYFYKRCRMQPLLSTLTVTLVHATISSCLNYFKRILFPRFIYVPAPSPATLCNVAASDPVKCNSEHMSTLFKPSTAFQSQSKSQSPHKRTARLGTLLLF